MSLDAARFANRAQDLMSNYPFLDHQTVVALAGQPGSGDMLHQQADTVAQAMSKTWDGYEQTWSDPVLQTKPSTSAGVADYVKNTIGRPPLDDSTIAHLQQSLQVDGFGTDLTADGAWTGDWQQRYNQALDAVKRAQRAGNEPGSVQTSKGLAGFLGHLTVTGAFDSIVGWAKSLPNDARIAAGEIGGGLAGLGHVVTHPSEVFGNSDAEKQTIATVNSAIQNALGGHTSKQKQVDAETLSGQLGALNSALSVALVTGVARKALVDLGETALKGTLPKGAEELTRKPGAIAKTLFNGNQNGRLLGSKWVGNLPGLARITPVVGKVAGADGWYYKTKTLLATPYRYAPVRVLGQGFSRTQLLGLGLYGQALATSKLVNNPEAQSVLGTHTLDAIDHNITSYGPRLFGWSPLDVNNLMLFLHGPAGMSTAGSASNTVGQATQGFIDRFTDMLGEKGVPAAFQQATGMSHHDWLKAADGDGHFLSAFMTSKVVGYAKDWWAQKQLGEDLHGAAKEQIQHLTQFKRAFNQLPNSQKAQAVSDMLASDPSGTWLTTRIRADIARGAVDAKAAASKTLTDFRDQYERMNKLRAMGGLKYLMTPKGRALLAEERMFHNDANLPPDFGTGEHMAQLQPNLEQDLGLARVDTLTRGDVLNKGGIADQFEKALQVASENPDPAARQQVAAQLAKHLFENHNWDERKLGLFGYTDNPETLLEQVRAEAEDLASEVMPTFDMPDTVRAEIDALRKAGYKIVVGDHLGDFYTGNLPDIGAGNGWLTGLRKWVGKAGLDPTRVPDKDVGRATRQGVVDELTPLMVKLRDEGVLDAYKTPQTLLSMLSEDGGVEKTLPRYLAGIFHGLSRFGLNKTEVEQLFKEGGAQSIEEARAELERKMASGIGLRDMSRKAIVDAILHTHTIKTASGSEWTWHGLPGGDLTDEELATASAEVKAARKKSVAIANQMFRAIQRGYRQPGYIMGWQMIENWLRAGYGFGDKIATRLPGSTLAQNVANWPNRVAQTRNRLRFTSNFIYDFRRWSKQSAKMAAEGVEPVANPLQKLVDDGAAITAKNLLLKIGGHPSELNDQMDADRMLAGRSVYGIYNPQWHGAYFVHQLREQGKSEEYIKAAYERAFKYGKEGGTSPLERAVNTVFFPFSFEKTLIRNFGSYLLDRPAQAMILDLAVDEWRKADKNGAIGQWVEDHFPVLWEMQLLNAFAHGISPGELGGINAPIIKGGIGVFKHAKKATTQAPTPGQKSLALLNLFLPQDWGANLTPKNLSRYLPVINQFANVWQSAIEQTQIATNALYDVVNHTTSAIRVRPTLTPFAQQQYGTREKAKMIDSLQPVLAFNAEQGDNADKIKWVASDQVPQTLWGQPINRSTIGEYVHAMYPAYDPNSGTAYAISQQRAEANYIAQVTAQDPAKGKAMQSFAHAANTVIGRIHRDQYTPADLASVQGKFNAFARTASGVDPDWKHLYEAFFAYALGPIESPQKKAS